MKITKASFLVSSAKYTQCPPADKAEFAFIGRSNVGKSSLINMLLAQKGLAKTSGTPGKTQLINHFLVNDDWYLVDLPGYGYAKISQTMRKSWEVMIQDYLKNRPNLVCIFVLLDSRHDLMETDLSFMNWLGKNGLPFVRVFTKIDKDGVNKAASTMAGHNRAMKKTWSELPAAFMSSAESKLGRDEILHYIEGLLGDFKTVKKK